MLKLPEAFKHYETRLLAAKARLQDDTSIEIIETLAAEKRWLELVLLAAFDPESAGHIKDPSLDNFWQGKLDALLPLNGSESIDKRHAFDSIAGRFCFYKGCVEPAEYSKALPKTAKANITSRPSWLELGATRFHDYLCCDRYCYNYFRLWNSGGLTAEAMASINQKCLGLATIALQDYGILGHGLLAMCCYFIGSAYKKLQDKWQSKEFRRASVNEAKAVLTALETQEARIDPRTLIAINFATYERTPFQHCCRFKTEEGETSDAETARIIIGEKSYSR